MQNLFFIPEDYKPDPHKEKFEVLALGANKLLLERIVSHGQVTEPGTWYDQEEDEWVCVLDGEAELSFPDGKFIRLGKGDQIFLPKHQRHRVEYTSSPCIWLAVHAASMAACPISKD